MTLASYRTIIAKGQIPKPFIPVGSHTTDATVSAATTLTRPAGATRLLLQTSTQNVRFTLDGTTPTATTGFLVTTTDGPVTIETVLDVEVIEVAASATIQYQWGL